MEQCAYYSMFNEHIHLPKTALVSIQGASLCRGKGVRIPCHPSMEDCKTHGMPRRIWAMDPSRSVFTACETERNPFIRRAVCAAVVPRGSTNGEENMCKKHAWGECAGRTKSCNKGHYLQNKSVHKVEIASKSSKKRGQVHEKCFHGGKKLVKSLSDGEIFAKVPIKPKL